MTTTPPSPTLRSRYSGADGGRGRVGAVHRTVAVVFSPAALALTVDWPGVAEVKANVVHTPDTDIASAAVIGAAPRAVRPLVVRSSRASPNAASPPSA